MKAESKVFLTLMHRLHAHSKDELQGPFQGERALLRFLAEQARAGEDCLTPTQIGQALSFSSARTSSLLHALQAKGLIERGVSPTDKRVRTVSLSTRGQTQTEQCRQAFVAKVDGLMTWLGEADAAELNRLLARICDYWEAADESAGDR